MPTPIEDIFNEASAIASRIDADVYLYNGPISRAYDLSCIESVSEHAGRKKAVLILVTGGGDPDAAYKISRYLQTKYEHFTMLVSGFCKSAGTLIALGAHELVFMPFGELGPLDIQLGKVDKFDAPQSGLAIQEALDTLEGRARKSYDAIISEYMQDNGGLLSFNLASQAASDFVTHLYSPIFARIDPEEVGARSRSMRIAHTYGQRLAVLSQNLKPTTLTTLAEKYPSHSFVIDRREAAGLFKNVRDANSVEKELVKALGIWARYPGPYEASRKLGSDVLFRPLSTQALPAKEANHAKAHARRRNARDGDAPPPDAGPAQPLARKAGKRRPRAVVGAKPNGKAGPPV